MLKRRAVAAVAPGDEGAGPVFARLAIYALVLSAALEGVVMAQRRIRGIELFYEGGVLEWSQFGILICCALVLAAASFKLPAFRQSCLLMATLPILAAIRELDHKFDAWFGKGAWGLTSIFVGTLVVLLAYRWRRALLPQIRGLARTRSFGYMAAAFLVVMSVSRIIGQKVFWKGLLTEEQYTRDVPRAVEELGELAGYLMLLFGVLELFFSRPPAAPADAMTAQSESAGEAENQSPVPESASSGSR